METNFTRSLSIHIKYIRDDILKIINGLYDRALNHDNSKWSDAERPYYEKTEHIETKNLKSYKEVLEATYDIVAPALDNHIKLNRHHPEHHKNGINDMNLIDIIEMVCDWHSSAKTRQLPLDIKYNVDRFNISPQLEKIIKNTVKLLDD
nr:MAG TPA: hypothetical protein [Caudoviricetes sp.]